MQSNLRYICLSLKFPKVLCLLFMQTKQSQNPNLESYNLLNRMVKIYASL